MISIKEILVGSPVQVNFVKTKALYLKFVNKLVLAICYREVEKALQTAKNLYTRWCELADQPNLVSVEEYNWTTNELRNSLRSIDWDVEDLEETVDILDEKPLTLLQEYMY